MVLQSLPLVVLMFIVFPRVQGTFLLRLSNPNVGLTGMSDHLQPGTFGSLVQSDEPAFRAQVNGGATLPQNELYWRALVLEIADSSMSWRATEQRRVSPRVPVPGAASERVEQRITIMPHGERWLYALDRPVDIQSGSHFPTQLNASDSVRSESPVYSKTIYTVTSDLLATNPQPLTADRLRFYTNVPSDLGAETLALARSWRRPGAKDEDVVHAALNYLRDGGFSYSLTPGPLPADHALDYFLFHSRKGFCEHYAAAFTSLMRAAGVPARIVVGYQGGEMNTWGKYYTVRQSDAHAWSEVWLAGRGWQREDPTAVIAPDRVSYGADGYNALSSSSSLDEESRLDRLRKLKAPGALRWLGHNALLAWDSLDQQWNLLVLGFDQEQQLNVLQRLNLGDLDLVGGTALTFATVVVLLSLVTVGMRLLNRGTARKVDPAVRAYGRFCRRLARVAGIVRHENEGPLDYARRAAGALPGQAAEIRRITDLYVASRYGAGGGRRRPGLRLRAGGEKFPAGRVRVLIRRLPAHEGPGIFWTARRIGLTWRLPMKLPLHVAVTGAAGQIGYSLLFRIASGAMFGPDQPVVLHLIEIAPALPALEGVKMELEDCAFPLLRGVVPTADLAEGFRGVHWALLVGSVPRKAGMERKDLLSINGKIFTGQGQAIAANAAPDVRVLVVGNPCNTNCLIAMRNARDVPADRWFAMTRLDENRAKAQLAQKAGVPVTDVTNLAIWGNHSATQYPDFYNAKIGGQPATRVITDQEWLEGPFISTVQQRGAAIIKARGLSSAASAANAVVDTVHSLVFPTPAGRLEQRRRLLARQRVRRGNRSHHVVPDPYRRR